MICIKFSSMLFVLFQTYYSAALSSEVLDRLRGENILYSDKINIKHCMAMLTYRMPSLYWFIVHYRDWLLWWLFIYSSYYHHFCLQVYVYCPSIIIVICWVILLRTMCHWYITWYNDSVYRWDHCGLDQYEGSIRQNIPCILDTMYESVHKWDHCLYLDRYLVQIFHQTIYTT